MADPDLVTVRVALFVPDEWLLDPTATDATELRGDDRGFTPHALGTGRSRIEQVVTVDFDYHDVTAYAHAGPSVERVTHPDGQTETKSDRASVDGVRCHSEVWGDDVRFRLECAATNPLVEDAPPTEYDFGVRVERDDTVHVEGRHDGFPNLEIHARSGFDVWREVYTYDHRDAGESPLSLAGDPSHEVDADG